LVGPDGLGWREFFTMPKGLLFWIIWILCILSYVGIFAFGFSGQVVTGAIVLVLTGLLGWHVFGPPIQ
jgi:hypothetical protein